MPVPATPGKGTEPGLVVYRFGADLFYANIDRFADEVRALVASAPTPVRWFIVDAGAITDMDYSAAQSIRDLLDDLARQRVGMVFARVSPYLRSDMDRHRITAALGETRIFATLHEAIAAVRGGALETKQRDESPTTALQIARASSTTAAPAIAINDAAAAPVKKPLAQCSMSRNISGQLIIGCSIIKEINGHGYPSSRPGPQTDAARVGMQIDDRVKMRHLVMLGSHSPIELTRAPTPFV